MRSAIPATSSSPIRGASTRSCPNCLEQQQAESDLRLTDRILNAARAAEGGALGLSEVLAALNEARVMHLIYDPDLRYAGAIADDGQLSSPPEHRAMVRVVEEPRLTERMVERCLADRSARDTRRGAGGGNAGRNGRGGRAAALVAKPAQRKGPRKAIHHRNEPADRARDHPVTAVSFGSRRRCVRCTRSIRVGPCSRW